MKFMRIPNVACYTLFIGFLLIGPLIMDWQEYGFRILQGIVILIAGFFATSIGLVGGGDSKFAAAMAPYISLIHVFPFLFIIGVVSFVSLGLHKLIGVTPGINKLITDWDSWNNHKVFPFGVTLAGSLIAYLMLNNWYS